MRAPNEARGERALTVGGQELLLCCTLDGLARVSAAIQAQTLHELYTKILGGEPNAVRAAISCFCVEGDSGAAVRNLNLADLLPAGKIAGACISHHMIGAVGNGEAGTEAE